MYKIIGGDQKEYGPVSFEQLTQWVRDNRANAQSLVQKEGGPWLPMGSLPEFSAILGEQRAATAPATPAMPTSSGAEQPAGLGGLTPVGPPPPGAYVTPGFGGADRAREMVQGPATALLVTGILCVVFSIAGLVLNLMGANFQPPAGELPPEMEPFINMMAQMQGPMAIISSLIGLVISGLIIFAAKKLRVLESFGLIVTATILAMIPCTSPCCCIGIPIGIWVLVVLFKPEVKSAFR